MMMLLKDETGRRACRRGTPRGACVACFGPSCPANAASSPVDWGAAALATASISSPICLKSCSSAVHGPPSRMMCAGATPSSADTAMAASAEWFASRS